MLKQMSASGKIVTVVDDDQNILLAMQGQLQILGFQKVGFSQADCALEFIQQNYN